MNRRQRRAASRCQHSAEQIRELQRRVEQTGRPGAIHGLTHACVDCRGTGTLHLLPGRLVVGEIYHSDGCPAAAGVVDWQPVQP